MSRLYVKPAPDRAVPVPEKGGKLLGEQGEWVPRNPYWVRRLNDKDVIEVDPPAQIEPAAEAAPVVTAEPAASKTAAKAAAKNGSDA